MLEILRVQDNDQSHAQVHICTKQQPCLPHRVEMVLHQATFICLQLVRYQRPVKKKQKQIDINHAQQGIQKGHNTELPRYAGRLGENNWL
jgi:hypothetical protein